MPGKLKDSIILMCILAGLAVAVLAGARAAALPDNDFAGSIILGRADSDSITASITASGQDSEVYLEWGEQAGAYTGQSTVYTASATDPAVILMDGLDPDRQYYYRLLYKDSGASEFAATPEYSFRTPRSAGEAYSFVIQSDSHLLNKADPELYRQNMENMAALDPDLMFDLGDTFLNDQGKDGLTPSDGKITAAYTQQLPYMSIVARSAPLYLTMGNHEGEYGYFLDGTMDNLAAMATRARTTFYPNPVPDDFYSGNPESEASLGQPQNYYAFTWGDALYVSIDPYRYTTMDPYENKDGWGWTLGREQYEWFRQTLEESNARYKLVFAHHAIGNMRGGAEIANLFEWGGYDRKGKYLFDEKRPGWGKPIQQVMKDTGVTIFFQGHDHLFAREVVEGVVYQTLPKPAEKTPDRQSNEASYPDGDILMNSGFLNVTVSPENVQVDYHRNYYVSTDPQEGNTGLVYSYTVNPEHQVTVLKTAADDFSTYGSTETENHPRPGQKDKDKQSAVLLDSEVTEESGGLILGCPSESSIEIKALAGSDCEAYFEYAPEGSSEFQATPAAQYEEGELIQANLDGLSPDTDYSYTMLVRPSGAAEYEAAGSGAFHTGREPGETFTFTLQSDSHRDENTDLDLYKATLDNIASEAPDFHIDLGDTFMGEKLALDEEQTRQRYLQDRGFFARLGSSVPLFLVNGNHEGENGWNMKGNDDDIATWASRARLCYFSNPSPDSFYSGSQAGQGNYYAFTWGDALFIMLDPFWFSEQKAKGADDGWNYTLGRTQYDWLKETLGKSDARYKFVFVHNLVGGYGKDARGGIEAASFFEWGGCNADGSYGFEEMRPGWDVPVHQLLVDNGVTAVFHGHDHFYARQELDGITYQLVPQPGHPGRDIKNSSQYGYQEGVFLPSSGHLKITVSSASARVDYVASSTNATAEERILDSYCLEPGD